MKPLILGCLVGSGLGYVAGNMLKRLPPLWNAVIVGVIIPCILVWAFRSLRRLRKEQQYLNKLMNQMRLRDFQHK
jgi:uncharacterized membrane-anchored protein